MQSCSSYFSSSENVAPGKQPDEFVLESLLPALHEIAYIAKTNFARGLALDLPRTASMHTAVENLSRELRAKGDKLDLRDWASRASPAAREGFGGHHIKEDAQGVWQRCQRVVETIAPLLAGVPNYAAVAAAARDHELLNWLLAVERERLTLQYLRERIKQGEGEDNPKSMSILAIRGMADILRQTSPLVCAATANRHQQPILEQSEYVRDEASFADLLCDGSDEQVT